MVQVSDAYERGSQWRQSHAAEYQRGNAAKCLKQLRDSNLTLNDLVKLATEMDNGAPAPASLCDMLQFIEVQLLGGQRIAAKDVTIEILPTVKHLPFDYKRVREWLEGAIG